jgi:hypothetical protein
MRCGAARYLHVSWVAVLAPDDAAPDDEPPAVAVGLAELAAWAADLRPRFAAGLMSG